MFDVKWRQEIIGCHNNLTPPVTNLEQEIQTKSLAWPTPFENFLGNYFFFPSLLTITVLLYPLSITPPMTNLHPILPHIDTQNNNKLWYISILSCSPLLGTCLDLFLYNIINIIKHTSANNKIFRQGCIFCSKTF